MTVYGGPPSDPSRWPDDRDQPPHDQPPGPGQGYGPDGADPRGSDFRGADPVARIPVVRIPVALVAGSSRRLTRRGRRTRAPRPGVTGGAMSPARPPGAPIPARLPGAGTVGAPSPRRPPGPVTTVVTTPGRPPGAVTPGPAIRTAPSCAVATSARSSPPATSMAASGRPRRMGAGRHPWRSAARSGLRRHRSGPGERLADRSLFDPATPARGDAAPGYDGGPGAGLGLPPVAAASFDAGHQARGSAQPTGSLFDAGAQGAGPVRGSARPAGGTLWRRGCARPDPEPTGTFRDTALRRPGPSGRGCPPTARSATASRRRARSRREPPATGTFRDGATGTFRDGQPPATGTFRDGQPLPPAPSGTRSLPLPARSAMVSPPRRGRSASQPPATGTSPNPSAMLGLLPPARSGTRSHPRQGRSGTVSPLRRARSGMASRRPRARSATVPRGPSRRSATGHGHVPRGATGTSATVNLRDGHVPGRRDRDSGCRPPATGTFRDGAPAAGGSMFGAGGSVSGPAYGEGPAYGNGPGYDGGPAGPSFGAGQATGPVYGAQAAGPVYGATRAPDPGATRGPEDLFAAQAYQPEERAGRRKLPLPGEAPPRRTGVGAAPRSSWARSRRSSSVPGRRERRRS